MPSGTIQWFPGHMAKTRRLIKENLKYTDIIIELLDARIPSSSRNPEIRTIVGDKPILTLLNKSSLADPAVTSRWIRYFESIGGGALDVDCVRGTNIQKISASVREILSEKIKRNESRGMVGKQLRAMIVGIPNVGKSSFINRISKQSRAKVEDRPGVTRGNQWFTISNNLEMLDTPGVLWPKFDDKTVGEHLAFTGAVKDQILDIELLAVRLLDFLKKLKPEDFITRFKLSEDELENTDSYELLQKRGMLISGGEVNTERAAIMLLDEFRAAKLGRITVEMPYGDLK